MPISLSLKIAILFLSSVQDFRVLVNDLDLNSWTARNAAHATLLKDEKCSQAWLEEVLEDASLSLETRSRLLQILVDRIIARPGGGLGIRMELLPIVRRGGLTYEVKVVELIKGMPAEKHLKIGDVIERLDGFLLSSRTALQEIVQSKSPKEVVVIQVRRKIVDVDGKPQLIGGIPSYEKKEILVPLGRANLLGAETVGPMKTRKIVQAKNAIKKFVPRRPDLEYIFVRIDENVVHVENFRKIIRRRDYIEELAKKKISSLEEVDSELEIMLNDLNNLLEVYTPKWPCGFLEIVEEEVFKIRRMREKVSVNLQK